MIIYTAVFGGRARARKKKKKFVIASARGVSSFECCVCVCLVGYILVMVSSSFSSLFFIPFYLVLFVGYAFLRGL